MSAHEMLHHGWQFGQVLKFGEGPLSGARGGRPRLPAHCFSGPLFMGWVGLGPLAPNALQPISEMAGEGAEDARGTVDAAATGQRTTQARASNDHRKDRPFLTASRLQREMRFTSPRPRANGCTAWRIAPRLGGCRMRRSLMIGQRKHFARGHCNELNARGEGMDHGASKPRHGLISDRQRRGYLVRRVFHGNVGSIQRIPDCRDGGSI